MNTTASSNGKGHRLQASEVLLFIGGLVVLGVLAFVLYTSAPRSAPPAGVNAPVSVGDARDPHKVKDAYIAAANAKRALAEQRRGEWSVSNAVNASDALQEQRRGEWSVSNASNAGDALHEQRQGEWNASNGCYRMSTKVEQAKCLGIR